jgi:uncharacterized integral membrane protein
MKILAFVALLAVALLAAFAALNWAALSVPAAASFGVVTAQAPAGVIVLGFAIGFALALFAYAAWQRTAQLIEERRVAREVADLRNLAANAEASRLRELREELASQMAALRRTIDESANGIAASVGQLDDKLDRLRSDERGLAAPGLERRKEARPGQ